MFTAPPSFMHWLLLPLATQPRRLERARNEMKKQRGCGSRGRRRIISNVNTETRYVNPGARGCSRPQNEGRVTDESSVTCQISECNNLITPSSKLKVVQKTKSDFNAVITSAAPHPSRLSLRCAVVAVLPLAGFENRSSGVARGWSHCHHHTTILFFCVACCRHVAPRHREPGRRPAATR